MEERTQFTIRPMTRADATAVSELVIRTFEAFNLSDYDDPDRFLSEVTKGHMEEFAKRGISLVALSGARVTGVIVILDFAHLELMFVDKDFQRTGIASTLWSDAISRVEDVIGSPFEITVNASSFATPFYESVGFQKVRGVLSKTTGQEINRMLWRNG